MRGNGSKMEMEWAIQEAQEETESDRSKDDECSFNPSLGLRRWGHEVSARGIGRLAIWVAEVHWAGSSIFQVCCLQCTVPVLQEFDVNTNVMFTALSLQSFPINWSGFYGLSLRTVSRSMNRSWLIILPSLLSYLVSVIILMLCHLSVLHFGKRLIAAGVFCFLSILPL